MDVVEREHGVVATSLALAKTVICAKMKRFISPFCATERALHQGFKLGFCLLTGPEELTCISISAVGRARSWQ